MIQFASCISLKLTFGFLQEHLGVSCALATGWIGKRKEKNFLRHRLGHRMQPGAILFSTHHQHSATREFHFPTRKESLLHCSVYIVHLYPSCQFCTLVSESGLIGSLDLNCCKPSVLKRRRQSPVSRRGTRMDLSLQRLPTLL